MASHSVPPFRFLDLPREIRNKIYRVLLCSVDPPPERIIVGSLADCKKEPFKAGHSIETSILRTCRSVYSEAYDVMVKTNRFVRVRSTGGLLFRDMINGRAVPVVTDKLGSIERFKGYVLDVTVGLQWPKPPDVPDAYSMSPISLILLGREMDLLCQSIAGLELWLPGTLRHMTMCITIGPVLTEHRTPYNDMFRDFFSESTQKTLLRPFREHIREVRNIRVCGAVSRAVATATQKEIAQDAWRDPKAILEDARDARERGNSCFRNHNMDEALQLWRGALTRIDRIHASNSWKRIAQQGGLSFLSEIAELFFVLQLNLAQGQLSYSEADRLDNPWAWLTDAVLNDAWDSLKEGFWAPSFEYEPPDGLKAKILYRSATYYRLVGLLDRALHYINKALQLAPNDPLIIRQKQRILEGLLRQGY